MTPNEEMKEYVLNLFDDELSWLITSSSKYDETDFESENRNAIQELANTLQSHRTEFLKMFEGIRLYDPELNKPNPSKDDVTFSVDVFIIDENKLHGLGYYHFKDCKWYFHTDTLVDYNEAGAETKWKWYYPVVEWNDSIDKKK